MNELCICCGPRVEEANLSYGHAWRCKHCVSERFSELAGLDPEFFIPALLHDDDLDSFNHEVEQIPIEGDNQYNDDKAKGIDKLRGSAMQVTATNIGAIALLSFCYRLGIGVASDETDVVRLTRSCAQLIEEEQQ